LSRKKIAFLRISGHPEPGGPKGRKRARLAAFEGPSFLWYAVAKMIIQIYEIQTPEEAERCRSLGKVAAFVAGIRRAEKDL